MKKTKDPMFLMFTTIIFFFIVLLVVAAFSIYSVYKDEKFCKDNFEGCDIFKCHADQIEGPTQQKITYQNSYIICMEYGGNSNGETKTRR